MNKLFRISLKGKILTLVVLLIIVITLALTSLFIYLKLQDDIIQAKELSLQTAITLSYLPVLHDYYLEDGEPGEIQAWAGQIKDEVGEMNVFFQNRDGTTFASTDENQTYLRLDTADNDKALIYGSTYVLKTEESDRTVLKAVSPVFVDYGTHKKVEGAIVVLYGLDVIYQALWEDIEKILKIAFFILVIGVIASYYLANSIRKDTLNLEPYEIAALYRERNAILQSVKEGILAVDDQGFITMMNSSAHHMLRIVEKAEGRQVSEVIESSELLKVLGSPEKQVNIEIQYKEKTMIVSTQPIYEENRRIGLVGSFRDRTEIKQMIDTLSEVKQYSDDLRAQAHEFSNKLYAILGLLQLGKKNDAIDFIKSETKIDTVEEDVLFSKIQDEKVQAILLGKKAQGSEKKIHFMVDPESSLLPLPERVPFSSLMIILGNLINNAFESVKDQKEKTVRFFVTDIGNEIIFEVMDTGKGMKDEIKQQIFRKGFSTKGENRGYGLANVNEEVDSLNGIIEFSSQEGEGTVFTVYLPK